MNNHPKPVVFLGPQGSGKTIAANALAGKTRPFKTCVYNDALDSVVHVALTGGERALVIDEIPPTRRTWSKLKSLVTSWAITVSRKDGRVRRDLPEGLQIICCSQGLPPRADATQERHFRIVKTSFVATGSSHTS